MSWLQRLEEKLSAIPTGDQVSEVSKAPFAPFDTSPPVGIGRIFSSRVDAPREPPTETEALYGRVTCLRCANLTRAGVCRARSTARTNYTPLQYEPVLLWRRCDDYRSA